MKLIPLTQGQFAKVDDDNYEELIKYNWSAHYSAFIKNYYCTRSVIDENGKKITLRMHSQILGDCKGYIVDHINHNPLDNRKENLRKVTYKENNKNSSLSKRNKSGFNGVYFVLSIKKWRALIRVDGKLLNLGLFKNKNDAINARKAANI